MLIILSLYDTTLTFTLFQYLLHFNYLALLRCLLISLFFCLITTLCVTTEINLLLTTPLHPLIPTPYPQLCLFFHPHFYCHWYNPWHCCHHIQSLLFLIILYSQRSTWSGNRESTAISVIFPIKTIYGSFLISVITIYNNII